MKRTLFGLLTLTLTLGAFAAEECKKSNFSSTEESVSSLKYGSSTKQVIDSFAWLECNEQVLENAEIELVLEAEVSVNVAKTVAEVSEYIQSKGAGSIEVIIVKDTFLSPIKVKNGTLELSKNAHFTDIEAGLDLALGRSKMKKVDPANSFKAGY